MIKLRIHNCDIFEVESESIILSIDGTGRGMGGRLAREFEKKYPEEWKAIEDKLQFPLIQGKVIPYIMQEEKPYKLIQIANILMHLSDPSLQEKETMVNNVFKQSIQNCYLNNINSLATGLLSGGWRLPKINTFQCMANAIESMRKSGKNLQINLCILNIEDYKIVEKYASSTGW